MTSIFGDLRLDKRLEELTEQMSAKPTANLPRLFKEWSSLKAGYRFMNNERVSHEKIIEVERQASMERIQADVGEVLLAVQDSTSFNFTKHPATQGLGVLDNNQSAGFFAHTTLAVSDKGVPLGILGQQVWSRPHNPKGKTNARKQKPIHEKESFKWLAGIRQLVPLRQRVVTVCDREADVYELFQDAKDRELDYIVRVDGNRRLEDAPLLRDYLREVSASDRYNIRVQRQVNQAAREAQVEVRYATVTLLPPERAKSARAMPLEPLTLQVVEVREIEAPATVKDPLHWILLTTLALADLDEAAQIVRFYAYRWLVERFHYVLKSGGCHFEESQLQSVDALQRLLAVCSRVAWRLLWMTYQARQTPDAPCTSALTATEWQALYAFRNRTRALPATPPSLQQSVRWIAQLGGFIGRKSDGDPGVKTLWRGWQRLQDIVATYSILHPPEDVGND